MVNATFFNTEREARIARLYLIDADLYANKDVRIFGQVMYGVGYVLKIKGGYICLTEKQIAEVAALIKVMNERAEAEIDTLAAQMKAGVR